MLSRRKQYKPNKCSYGKNRKNDDRPIVDSLKTIDSNKMTSNTVNAIVPNDPSRPDDPTSGQCTSKKARMHDNNTTKHAEDQDGTQGSPPSFSTVITSVYLSRNSLSSSPSNIETMSLKSRISEKPYKPEPDPLKPPVVMPSYDSAKVTYSMATITMPDNRPLAAHGPTPVVKNFMCPLCDTRFSNPNTLEAHVKFYCSNRQLNYDGSCAKEIDPDEKKDTKHPVSEMLHVRKVRSARAAVAGQDNCASKSPSNRVKTAEKCSQKKSHSPSQSPSPLPATFNQLVPQIQVPRPQQITEPNVILLPCVYAPLDVPMQVIGMPQTVIPVAVSSKFRQLLPPTNPLILDDNTLGACSQQKMLASQMIGLDFCQIPVTVRRRSTVLNNGEFQSCLRYANRLSPKLDDLVASASNANSSLIHMHAKTEDSLTRPYYTSPENFRAATATTGKPRLTERTFTPNVSLAIVNELVSLATCQEQEKAATATSQPVPVIVSTRSTAQSSPSSSAYQPSALISKAFPCPNCTATFSSQKTLDGHLKFYCSAITNGKPPLEGCPTRKKIIGTTGSKKVSPPPGPVNSGSVDSQERAEPSNHQAGSPTSSQTTNISLTPATLTAGTSSENRNEDMSDLNNAANQSIIGSDLATNNLSGGSKSRVPCSSTVILKMREVRRLRNFKAKRFNSVAINGPLFLCKICRKTFKTSRLFEQHACKIAKLLDVMTKNHTEEKGINKHDDNSILEYSCNDTGETYSSSPFSCKFCQYYSPYKGNLKRHLTLVHKIVLQKIA